MNELKEKIKKELEDELKRLSEEKTKNELTEQLIEKNDFELPESMINYEIDRIISEIAAAYRIDVESLKKNKEEYEKYRQNLRERAIKNIKYELLLSEIAKKEGLEAKDDEVDEEIKKYAEENKKDFNELKKTMKSNNSYENLRYQISLRKAMDFIFNNAKFEKTEKLEIDKEDKGEVE